MSEQEREDLIKAHIGLVRHVVGRVVVRLPEGVDRDDLESAGIMGLIKAADRFDPTRGVKFATYASAVVRGEVMEALRAKDWAPRSLRRRYRELEQTIAQLQRQLGRQPDQLEICRALHLSEEEYQELLSETSSMAITSLDELMEGEESPYETGEEAFAEPQGSAADPAEVLDQETIKELLAEAVNQLPERDRIVIGLYYQDELTLREIGEVLDITESRVCQIHTQAITRLRATIKSQLEP
jgi:RNA polymerase sigma factor for flagellar operon FliA